IGLSWSQVCKKTVKKMFICLKPGHCPKSFMTNGKCCTVNQKCCFNGCDYICTPSVPEKPGSCPYKQFTPWCYNFCDHDGDCPGAKKFCPTSCGRACRQP
uniref:WAP domain-containing protein n=1 Tax=Xiphophorus couchianus TaxID=32473 RepID=A0A3B5LCC4_9TELE